MALYIRDFHSFSTIQEHGPQGWNWCMSKAYCKWPVIVAIIIAIVISIFTLYCCLRCCGCCGRRGARRSRKNTQPSMFNPLPYQGYQPANAPPPYGNNAPQQFAQFDAPSQAYGPTRKIGEDSLPAMPSWSQAQSKKIEDDDVEMGHIDPAKGGLMNNASAADLSHPAPSSRGYSQVDNPAIKEHYSGPDFGAVDTSYGGAAASTATAQQQQHHPYTGPDFSAPKAYAPYAPSSESTKYEPSGVNEPHEQGTTYSNTLPPPSPSAQHTGFSHATAAPSVLQAGRGHGPNNTGFRDV